MSHLNLFRLSEFIFSVSCSPCVAPLALLLLHSCVAPLALLSILIFTGIDQEEHETFLFDNVKMNTD